MGLASMHDHLTVCSAGTVVPTISAARKPPRQPGTQLGLKFQNLSLSGACCRALQGVTVDG